MGKSKLGKKFNNSDVVKLLKKLPPCDFILVYATALLLIFGVVMVFSSSYYFSISESLTGSPYAYVKKHIVFLIIGIVLCYGMSAVKYQHLRYASVIAYPISILLLLLLFTPLGQNTYGATRWLNVGGITIMPGEVVKPVAILVTSTILAADPSRIRSFKKGLLPLALIIIVYGILIIKQPNLSTALTVCGTIVGVMFIGGLSWGMIVTTVGAVGASFVMLLAVKGGYWLNRISSFLHPFEDPRGVGYQVVQSLYALGTGGVGGLGLGKSVQKNLYLPFAQNDFIMSIVGEELGFFGVICVMAVYMILIWRCFVIAINAPDRFGTLFAGGVGILIGLQVVIHVAVISSSMPPTGITLPLISYGGNSLWVFLGLLGVVFNISRQSKGKKPEVSGPRLKGGR